MPIIPLPRIVPNQVPFTLGSDATAISVGIYDSTGYLLRTIFSCKPYKAGTHTIPWDGNDDDGNPQTTGLTYTAKILSSSVTYTWEGVLPACNNSADPTGSTVFRLSAPITDIVEVGSDLYGCCSFSEGRSAQFKCLKSDPTHRIDVQPEATGQQSYFTCANLNYIFFAGTDYDAVNNFVFGINVSNDAETAFTSGAVETPGNGRTYNNALDLNTSGSTGKITGMSVSSKYLFVAHVNQNLINVYDISTIAGTFVRSISITAPGNIFFESDTVIWISQGTTVTKYPVNTNGTLGSSSTQITGLTSVRGLSLNGTDLCIADGGSQGVIKRFNKTTGSSTSTLGTVGGYSTSEVVTNTKFYWDELRGTQPAFVKHLSNGDIWIGDGGNNRCLHFDSSATYIEQIRYIPQVYSCNIVGNQNTNIFAGFQEYLIDYSQPFASCSTLINNWGYNYPPVYVDTGIGGTHIPQLGQGRPVSLMSNSRRYAICLTQDNVYFMIEYVASSGIRVINSTLPQFAFLDKDGNMYKITTSGSNTVYNKYTLTGFSGNNPTYSSSSVVSTLTLGSTYPQPGNGYKLTTSGIQVLFDNSNNSGAGYHLAGFNGNTPKWKNLRSTFTAYDGDFPNANTFDIGNIVINPGMDFNVIGNDLIGGYHGENWKAGQTNMFWHYSDIGLPIGIFGVVQPQLVDADAPPAEYATNVFSPELALVSGVIYMYTGDEDGHGIQRWKIDNLSSVSVQSVSFILDGRSFTPVITKTDLLASGITIIRNPSSDIAPGGAHSFVTTKGNTTYKLGKSLDVRVDSQGISETHYYGWQFPVFSGLNDWTVNGQLDVANNSFIGSEGPFEKCYIDILDSSSKVIARVDFYQTGRLGFNGQFYPATAIQYGAADFVLKKHGSNIYLYFDFFGTPIKDIQAIFDGTANIANPKYFRMGFTYTAVNKNAGMGTNELWFQGQ